MASLCELPAPATALVVDCLQLEDWRGACVASKALRAKLTSGEISARSQRRLEYLRRSLKFWRLVARLYPEEAQKLPSEPTLAHERIRLVCNDRPPPGLEELYFIRDADLGTDFLGSCRVYNNFTTERLLPARDIQQLDEQLCSSAQPELVALARTCVIIGHSLLLDRATGHVYVMAPPYPHFSALAKQPCARVRHFRKGDEDFASGPIRYSAAAGEQRSWILEYLELWASRVESGDFAFKSDFAMEGPNGEVPRYLCMFPVREQSVTAVTGGIEVRVGTRSFVRSAQKGANDDVQLILAYQIGIRMLPGAELGQRFEKVKLLMRHWRIQSDLQVDHVEHVDGSGVIGLHPEFFPGHEPFEYASCTHLTVGQEGAMWGWFDFLGRKSDGQEEQLRIEVPRFALKVESALF